MKRLVFDLDGTLTIEDPNLSYEDKAPNLPVVEALREYHRNGFTIMISTARNMRSHQGNMGKIVRNTVPVILAWLERHGIPCDELHVGKPWCGEDGFYVDDRAIRPDEFARLNYEEIKDLLKISG